MSPPHLRCLDSSNVRRTLFFPINLPSILRYNSSHKTFSTSFSVKCRLWPQSTTSPQRLSLAKVASVQMLSRSVRSSKYPPVQREISVLTSPIGRSNKMLVKTLPKCPEPRQRMRRICLTLTLMAVLPPAPLPA